jgi:WD40 repeat protein
MAAPVQQEGVSAEPLTERRLFDAFVSYAHQPDLNIATALQHELERFGRPWYRARVMRVFRDTATLAPGPDLQTSIESALASSRWFVLLASPEAAASVYVDKEVQWWLSSGDPDHFIIVLTGGELSREGSADGHRDHALPPSAGPLRDREPLWLDLRWARDAAQLDAKDPRFLDSVAAICAAVRGVSKDEVVGEHLVQRKRTRRVMVSTVAVLMTLLLVAIAGAVIATNQRNVAIRHQFEATSRQLVSASAALEDTQPGLARQLLAQAYRLSPTSEALGGVLRSSLLPREFTAAGADAAVAVNPVREQFAVAAGDLLLYDYTGAVTTRQPQSSAGFTGPIAYSASGALLAAMHPSGRLGLWSSYSGERLDVVTLGPRVRSIAFDRTEDIVVATTTDFRLIFVDARDATRSRMLSTLHQAERPEEDRLVMNPDGVLVANSSADQGRWQDDVPVPVLTLLMDDVDPASTAITSDEQLLAVPQGDDSARLWDVGDPARPVQRALLPVSSLGASAVAFSADGQTLAVAAGDGSLQLWDVADPLRPRSGALLGGRTDTIRSLRFGANGRSVVAVNDDATTHDATGSATRGLIRIWQVEGSERSPALSTIEGARQAIPSWSADSALLVAGAPAQLWNMQDRQRPSTISRVPTLTVGGGSAMAISPAAPILGSGNPAVVWDITRPEHPEPLAPDVVVEEVVDVAWFSPDGLTLATGDSSSPIALWDVSHRGPPRLLAQLSGSSAEAQGTSFAGGSTSVATTDERGHVQIWDYSTRDRPALRGSIPHSGGRVQSVAFAPDARTLLTGDSTGVVSSWDVTDPTRPHRSWSVSRHSGPVTGLAATPTGTTAASASEDGTVHLWDLTAPLRPRDLASFDAGGRYDGAVLSFSPDGRTLAAATNEGIVFLDVDVPGLLRQLCADSAAMTESQWSEYLPDLPYDPPCA